MPPQDAGMHLVGWLPPGVDDRAGARIAAQHSVEAPPLSAFCLATTCGGLALGYAAFSAAEIRDGVQRLACALQEVVGGKRANTVG